MTKYITSILCVIAICFSQNLLQNPGFEAWSVGMPDYWFKDDSIAIFQEDVIVHDGNSSAKDSLFTETQSWADFIQRIPVQPNTQYIYNIWVYDNDDAGRVRQGIYWVPSGSNWGDDYSVDSTGWQLLEWTVTSPAGAESADVLIRAYDISANWDGDAIFYLDDAYFAQPSTQPPIIARVWHKPMNPGAGVVTNVYAYVSDDGTIDADTLFYGVNDLSSPTKITHASVSNDTFQYQIPGQTSGDTVFYYLRFVDNEGLDAYSDTHAYYVGELGFYINEILYDTDGTDEGCFIEVYGPGDASLDGFTVIGVNGYNGEGYKEIDLTGYSIPSDGFFVIAQDVVVSNSDLVTDSVNYQNGPDNIELRFHNLTIDALGYGELGSFVFTGEWIPAPDVGPDTSLGRYPDGDDTDNNYDDFLLYAAPTPGLPNPDIGISEIKESFKTFPLVTNPVVSGLKFASVIMTSYVYPISVYSVTGQLVKRVESPEVHINLATGIYFLKLNNIEKGCAKLIVVR